MKVRDFFNSALKATMADELVSKFLWTGGKNFEKFGDTRVSNTLCYAGQKCSLFRSSETKAEYKGEMLEVLRITKQRHRNFLNKNVETESTVEIKENQSLDELLTRIEDLEKMADESDHADEDEFQGDDEFEDTDLVKLRGANIESPKLQELFKTFTTPRHWKRPFNLH